MVGGKRLFFEFLELLLSILHIMIQFHNTGAYASKLRIRQGTLLVEVHCHLSEFVEQSVTLIHKFIDFALLATHTHLFLGFPASAADRLTDHVLRGFYKVGHNFCLPFKSFIGCCLFSDGVLVDTHLFRLATLAQLYGDDIYAPGAFRTSVKIEIVGGYLHQFLPFTERDRIFG